MDQPAHFQNQDSLIIEGDEIIKTDTDSDSNTEAAVPCYWQSAIFTKNDQFMVNRIEEGTRDYVNVKRSFVNGMRNFDKHIEVVAIHRRNYQSSVIDEARLEAFRVFAAAVASRNGGDPNIKFGWYGGSREEIREILFHGFCSFENRSSSHGHGVYFSPANNPIASARLSIADVDGLMHVLLCRLILGKPEPIPFGSQIDLPTSTEFNSGVDDISSPTKYIIWEPYMNTTILPIFIVTFKRETIEIGDEPCFQSSSHVSCPFVTRNIT
ncbi:probable inactive poly [ADP-ribose] polymerase SRO2 isoform X1 [Lactuca sativa]|uniref:probable inactive poly [ADP-ribose] polymerase SRO2 isoform X1 n=1 Tax=Lactuca sativa TaxID=4236 RepID=UPI001C68FB7C|nr:probable inactive poly [ADP-ribose] polymerase SRO2 isoform X1 [Lactuca sativa]